MSHSSINDKLRKLAKDIQAGVDNSVITIGIDTAKAGGDYSVTKHTGWLVLRRIEKQDGTTFIAPSLLDTKHDADVFASCFDNVVAIMPIEWEE